MGLVAGQDGAADGYEPVLMRPDRPESSAAPVAALFHRRSVQASRRGVLHLRTASDGPVPSDLASWYTERGFHFYVATLAWPGRPRSPDSTASSDSSDTAATGSAATESAGTPSPGTDSPAGGSAAPGPAGAMAARAAMAARRAAAARPGDAAGPGDAATARAVTGPGPGLAGAAARPGPTQAVPVQGGPASGDRAQGSPAEGSPPQSDPARGGAAHDSAARDGDAQDGVAQDGVDAEPATAVRAMALTALRMAGQQGSGSGAAGPAAPTSPAGAVPRQGRAAGAAGARLSKAGAAAGAHAASVLPSAAGPAVPGLPAGRWDDATAQLPSPARDHAPDNGRGPAKDDVPARDGGTAKLGVPAGDHAPDKGRGLARDNAPAGDHARARGRGPAKLGGPAKVAGPAKDGAPDPEDEPGDSAARAAAGKVRAGRRGRRALAGAFAELDARCAQLRAEDGIDNVIVMAHGAAALPAALWCAAQPPGGRADALILYGPEFAGAIREGLDIDCPVLIIGGSGGQQRRGPALRRRPAPAPTAPLGRHVTWLHPADGDARPDAEDAADRSRFFDEMGRWLGAYMYGQVRDQLL